MPADRDERSRPGCKRFCSPSRLRYIIQVQKRADEPMETSAGDLRKSTRSATSWRKGVCAMAAMAMLALAGNGADAATKSCHDIYHDIRQPLYKRANVIADRLGDWTRMLPGTRLSAEQCAALRDLKPLEEQLVSYWNAEKQCVAHRNETPWSDPQNGHNLQNQSESRQENLDWTLAKLSQCP
jgi:hypothetical protein